MVFIIPVRMAQNKAKSLSILSVKRIAKRPQGGIAYLDGTKTARAALITDERGGMGSNHDL
jgi:hypothetical protein